MPNPQPDTTAKSSPLLVLLAWAFVLIPTAWGLSNTIQSAMKLFTAPAPAAAAPQKT